MSQGYFCAECEEVFEFPTLIDETTWEEAHGVRARHEECILACPFCESYDVEETRICETCKTEQALDGVDYCFGCTPTDVKEDDAEFVAAMRNT